MLANGVTDFMGDNPVIVGIVGLVLFILVFFTIFKLQRTCDVCGLPIKRKYYSWTIDGKKQTLCPKCSSRLENKVSKSAFKSRFG
jgi:hypothetical protein